MDEELPAYEWVEPYLQALEKHGRKRPLLLLLDRGPDPEPITPLSPSWVWEMDPGSEEEADGPE
jgi:RecJ-like exonuclease